MQKDQIKSASGNSVIRALDILETMTYAPAPLGVSEISKSCSLNRTTTYHLLSSLMEKGYICKGDNAKYHVTSRLFELGTAYQNSFPLVHLVKRFRFEFSSAVKYTCKLSILTDNLRAIILYSYTTETNLRQLPLGYAFPLHTSAAGKVLLAFSPQSVRDNFFKNCRFEPYTERTITDPEQFKTVLDKVVQNGYATDEREFMDDQICIGAPVRTGSGGLSAISISGSCSEFLTHKDELTRELLGYTQSLSFESGYTAFGSR
ncbi:MAG: IclR family transcriptional regulator [Oscillospiraceae bacterium]|nr:IclR family transcriptional regulator [Oscillospiraceae bacterium]